MIPEPVQNLVLDGFLLVAQVVPNGLKVFVDAGFDVDGAHHAAAGDNDIVDGLPVPEFFSGAEVFGAEHHAFFDPVVAGEQLLKAVFPAAVIYLEEEAQAAFV
jgi:hypothetical protein